MIILYKYVVWSKPKLSEVDALMFGKEIHKRGKAVFISQFGENLNKSEGQTKERWRPNVFGWIFVILFAGCGIYFFAFTRRGNFLFFVVLFLTAFYFGTAEFAKWRYKRWLTQLEAKYLSYCVASNLSPETPHTPIISPDTPVSVTNPKKKLRILAVCSAVWLLLVFVIAFNEASGYRFQTDDFINAMLLVGVLPLLVIWGVLWVRRQD